MIDRYAIYSDFQDINKHYGLRGEAFTVPNYNASPAQQLPVITNLAKKEISFIHWGINKQWSNNKTVSPKLLTVKSDLLLSKVSLKKALIERRCIVPVNGFYLWKHYSKKRKTPHYFNLPEQDIFSLIGIWEEFEDMEGSTTHTFKILEVSNQLNAHGFPDFLPIVITKDDEKIWLDDYSSEEQLLGVLQSKTLTSRLTNHPVSPHISNQNLNFEDLIKPQAQADQLGNYTLFD